MPEPRILRVALFPCARRRLRRLGGTVSGLMLASVASCGSKEDVGARGIVGEARDAQVDVVPPDVAITDAGTEERDSHIVENDAIEASFSENDAADSTLGCAAEPCVLHLAVGSGHACALMSDGAVRCWGTNRYGQLGSGTLSDAGLGVQQANLHPTPVVGLPRVVQLAAGEDYSSCAVPGEGRVC